MTGFFWDSKLQFDEKQSCLSEERVASDASRLFGRSRFPLARLLPGNRNLHAAMMVIRFAIIYREASRTTI